MTGVSRLGIVLALAAALAACSSSDPTHPGPPVGRFSNSTPVFVTPVFLAPTSTPDLQPISTADVPQPWAEILGKIPLSLKEQGIWFGNRNGALEAAGIPVFPSAADLQAMSQSEKEA